MSDYGITGGELYDLYLQKKKEADAIGKQLSAMKSPSKAEELRSRMTDLLDEAEEYLNRAGEANDPEAMALLIHRGEATQNYAALRYWLEKAGESGDGNACDRLAELYETGKFKQTSEDPAERAAFWHHRAFQLLSESKVRYILDKLSGEYHAKERVFNLALLAYYAVQLLLTFAVPVLGFILAAGSLLAVPILEAKYLRGYSSDFIWVNREGNVAENLTLPSVRRKAAAVVYGLPLIVFLFGNHPVLRSLYILVLGIAVFLYFTNLRKRTRPCDRVPQWNDLGTVNPEDYWKLYKEERFFQVQYETPEYSFPKVDF